MPLGAWQNRFVRLIEQPEEDALLEAAILLDFRQLHGELVAEQPLRRVMRGAAGNRRFLGRLAAAGAPADDVVAFSELTELQRHRFKQAMHLVHICQESLRITYRTDLIA